MVLTGSCTLIQHDADQRLTQYTKWLDKEWSQCCEMNLKPRKLQCAAEQGTAFMRQQERVKSPDAAGMERAGQKIASFM